MYAGTTPSSVVVTNSDDDAGGVNGYCVNWEAGNTVGPAICQPWLDYISTLTGSFSSIVLRGTGNPAGIICSNPAVATTICNALQTHTQMMIACGADTWQVSTDYCGMDHLGNPAVEITVNSEVCTCGTQQLNSAAIRPCYLANCDCGDHIGGVGTLSSCNNPTQMIAVQCIR